MSVDILADAPATDTAPTGYAVFDAHDRLVALDGFGFAGLSGDPGDLKGTKSTEFVRRLLPAIRRIDGEAPRRTAGAAAALARRWRLAAGQPFEIELRDRSWRLLTAHPTPDGGTTCLAIDITASKRDAEARSHIEELFRAVTESHPLPVWMVDIATGEILYESRAASRILGRDWDPVRPQYILDHYVDPTDRNEVIRLIEERGMIEDHEVRLKRADGTEFWISATVRRGVYDGRPVLVSGVLELTERKQREAEIAQAREMLEDAIASLSEGFALYGPDQRLVVCNEKYREHHYTCREIVEPGRTWDEIVATAVSRGQYRDAIGREQEWLEENRRQLRYGEQVEHELANGKWMATTLTPTRQGGFVVIRSDITEHKRREAELCEARETLQDAIESLTDGFAVFDGDHRLVMCNARYRDTNYTCQDILVPGMHWQELMRTGAERGQYPAAVGRIEEWLRERAVEPLQFGRYHLFEQSDGHWYEAGTTPTRHGGFVVIRRDVTDRKRMEEDLREREEQLRFFIENHPLPVWMNDARTGEILHSSAAAKRFFGWKEAGKPIYLRDFHVDGEEFVELSRSLRDLGRIDECEVHMLGAGGVPVWVMGNALLTEFRGREVVLVGIVDVTSRKEREEQFRFILEGHPLPVWMNEVESGEIIYESRAAARLFGRAWNPAERKFTTDHYVNPDDRLKLLQMLREEGGEVEDFETLLKKVDGTYFWATCNVRLLEYQGREVLLVGLLDLTNRKVREAEMARSGEIMRDAIESLAEGFALYDPDDRLIMCNQRYREMNRECTDLLVPGVKWLDILRAGAECGQYGDIEDIDAWLAERVHDRASYRQNHEFQHADGRWYSVSNSPTRQGGTVVTRVDITERKLNEEARREQEAVVRQVLEACPVPIQMTGRDGRILYRSPATKMLFGDTESALDYYANPEDRVPYVEKLRATGSVDDFEVQLKRADGSVFWGSVSSRMITFHGEEVIVSNTLDLTDRRAVEAQLARQREALHQSEKLSALGELLAGVAHELNNPLSVVVGQALLLKETVKDPALVERARKIGNAAERCARIVKTFLAMARQKPAASTAVDMNEAMYATLDVTGYSLRAAGVDVSLSLAADLPAVWADPDQLSQVLINLIVNAEQALQGCPDGRLIAITTRHDPDRGEVELRISDNGPGIPEDIRSRIFEPFFTTKDVGSGTGIGLAFCHRIVEAHGGSIGLEDTPGGGATFILRLPVAMESGSAAPVQSAASGARALSVLVIDDEPDVAELLEQILTSEGHRVTVAGSGIAALEELERRKFDILLSDLKMPHLDGPRLFQELKSYRPALVERLAFVTGDTMSPKAREFLESSGRPYIEKPIRPNDIKDLVRRMIGTSGADNADT